MAAKQSPAVGFPIPDWQACQRPPSESLVGTYCRVEPFDLTQHADSLYTAFGLNTDEVNWTYLPYGPFKSKGEFIDWIEAASGGSDPLFHSIIDKSTGKAVGLATYLRIEPSIGVIEVGHIHFSPLIQRTSISTEAMFLMMQRVFDELGYRRYEWKCDALNEPSKKAALRLGFTFEGIFRQATMYKGRNRDTAWFSIIDGEWPAIKTGFEQWLSADNFNEHGQQRQSLMTIRKR